MQIVSDYLYRCLRRPHPLCQLDSVDFFFVLFLTKSFARDSYGILNTKRDATTGTQSQSLPISNQSLSTSLSRARLES